MTAQAQADGGTRSTTIATIAGEVGVSVATVSKVLNGRADVAADTRARVEKSLERHAYQRRSKKQQTGTGQIDLVFHELDSVWAMEIIRGVEEVTAAAGLEVTLAQLAGKHHPPQAWLDTALTRRPLGVVFVLSSPTEAQQQQLRRQGIAFAVVDTDSATTASVPTVGSNNWNGGQLAAHHLFELGHRRIAMISGPEDVLCSRTRLAGFRFAHDEAGVPVDASLVRNGNFTTEAGYEHGTALLDRPDRPTAIFAGSDLQALGVLRAARRLGLDLPGQLSVVGYDNLPVAAWTDPALTTIDQPLREMAGIAAQMVIDLARGVDLSTSRVDLVTTLVVRESSAPPAS
jgi:DNA-binding LacI/PurR family transcriptional regulator